MFETRWLGYALPLVGLKILILLSAFQIVHSLGRTPSLCAWDCVHYKEIAEQGYSFTPGKQGTMAFFPVFPKTVGALSQWSGASFEVAGVALNLALFFVVLVLFFRWSQLVGLKWPWLPPTLLAVDRHSFWSHIPYTEALFVTVLLLFFLLDRDSAHKPIRRFVVTLIAGFASGTRLVGVAFVGGLGLGNLTKYLKRPDLGVLTLLLGLLGVIAYFTYLEVAHGSWKLSLITTSFWNRYHTFFGIFESLRVLFSRMYFPTVLVFLSSVWLLVKPPRALNLTGTERMTFAFLLYIPMANSVQLGLTRYLTVLLVGYVGLAYALERAWASPKYQAAPRWIKTGAIAFLAALALSELYWQVILTRKFLLNEAFFWAA